MNERGGPGFPPHVHIADSDTVRMRNDMAFRETGTEWKTVMAKFPKSFPLDVIGAYRIAGLSGILTVGSEVSFHCHELRLCHLSKFVHQLMDWPEYWQNDLMTACKALVVWKFAL
ncbi:hypothetical protein GOBAR_DD11602 [Gossypium barbadense]|nr:hypothetical protein GOBAR_DD11602 [Gossypium barbadense]